MREWISDRALLEAEDTRIGVRRAGCKMDTRIGVRSAGWDSSGADKGHRRGRWNAPGRLRGGSEGLHASTGPILELEEDARAGLRAGGAFRKRRQQSFGIAAARRSGQLGDWAAAVAADLCAAARHGCGGWWPAEVQSLTTTYGRLKPKARRGGAELGGQQGGAKNLMQRALQRAPTQHRQMPRPCSRDAGGTHRSSPYLVPSCYNC